MVCDMAFESLLYNYKSASLICLNVSNKCCIMQKYHMLTLSVIYKIQNFKTTKIIKYNSKNKKKKKKKK